MSDNFDPIDLEVLRTRLESVGEDGCRAVENTAVSPAITESKDYSITLMNPKGGLVIGSGPVFFHYGAAAHAVRSTIARHGSTIAPGDVFLANDPHSGGGLHPQDVVVQKPVFVRGELVGWVGASAHLMDMGGMIVGSFAPEATECYQESFRIPSVRIFRKGEEVTDVWDLLRTNVRMATLVEMDLRGLVAGCNFAAEKVAAIAEAMTPATFLNGLNTISALSEREVRRRISQITDGVYKATSWTEFEEEFFEVPCTVTVEGDSLTFDFAGASPQCSHFFNSKPHVVEAELAVLLAERLFPDLPFNDGVFAPVKVICPEGTIVNSQPPAPISAAHMHVGLNAAGVALQALTYALAASPDSEYKRFLIGAGFESAIATQLWSWTQANGHKDAWLAFDGLHIGGSASVEHDGPDLGRNAVGFKFDGSYPDIEILESWFPLMITERRTRPGTEGAGVNRAGSGNQFSFHPYGINEVTGIMFGMRRWLPLQGVAGGRPGACNDIRITRANGSVEQIGVAGSGNFVRAGDSVTSRLANGGGFGDPLDREAERVAEDVSLGRFTKEEAYVAYGVVLDRDGMVDTASTEAARSEHRKLRLSKAQPPIKVPRAQPGIGVGATELPLYPGVVQRGHAAFAKESGALLAIAPDHWTDGCAVLTERRWPEGNPDVVYRSYLDPKTGRALHVEVALAQSPRSFIVAPRRWTEVAKVASAA